MAFLLLHNYTDFIKKAFELHIRDGKHRKRK